MVWYSIVKLSNFKVGTLILFRTIHIVLQFNNKFNSIGYLYN